MKDLEKLLKAVANSRRLQILQHLKREGGATVSSLAKFLKLSFKSTSKHLKVLSAVDIIQYEHVGLNMVYHLVPKQHQLIRILLNNL